MKKKNAYPRQSSQTKSSSMPAQSVVRPPETMHTSYPVSSIVVFRETTSTVQPASCSLSSSVASSARGIANSVSDSDGVSDLDPSKHFSSVFLKDQEEHSTQSLGFGFSGLFDFLFLSCLNKFLL